MGILKRARTKSGHYVADDPSTPENEAWVEEKPKKKKASKAESSSDGIPPVGSAARKAMILRGEIEE
tara:strand:+ start:66 stop:266 length:201 start_codon:yes stop_codon:yes gene_type:complete